MKSKIGAVAVAFVAALMMAGCAAPGERLNGYLSTTENVAKIQVGKTTSKETEQLLGAPVRVTHDGRRNRDYWEYRVYRQWSRSTLWIGISIDGVVREVVQVLETERLGTNWESEDHFFSSKFEHDRIATFARNTSDTLLSI